MSKTATLKVERIPLDQLKELPGNPRVDLKLGMPQYEDLKQSLEEHGYVDGVVWNKRTGHVVGGHQRLAVLKDLGYTEADVQVIDAPAGAEERLNIILNSVSGTWNYGLLAARLSDFDDLNGLGFQPWELQAILGAEKTGAALGGDDDPPPTGAGSITTFLITVHCEDRGIYDQLLALARAPGDRSSIVSGRTLLDTILGEGDAA